MNTEILNAATTGTSEGLRLWQIRSKSHAELPEIAAEFFSSFFGAHGRDFPWRKAADPYLILIAEILLQKTRGDAVVPVWTEFMRRWPTVKKLANARIKSIEKVLLPLGLRKRAVWLHVLAKALAGSKGKIPDDYAELLTLPGVGEYSANAVLCQAYGRSVPMVDVNAGRIYCRIYGVDLKTKRQILVFATAAATTTIIHGDARAVNLGVLDFAEAICRPRPECPICPLRGESLR